ncbi:transcription-repair coupling factor [Buchnera aphidicola]|uniref:transcription-repair coupling factor n=1 Tax=Buchnera aphidicola TaxID=9 RepID=UPI003463E6BA
MNKFNGKIIFFIKHKKHYHILLKLISGCNISLQQIYNLHMKQFFTIHLLKRYFFIIKEREHGLIDTKNNFAFICENDFKKNQLIDCFLLENTAKKTNYTKKNWFEIHNNEFVVHFEHGIGRYQGLIILENNGINNEYFIIEYANKAKLYVPIQSLNLISAYHTANKNIVLNKLGSDQWIRERKKIEKKIYDSTAMLLDTYANRANQIGFNFNINSQLYDQFCNKFPFLLTPDQKKVIYEVLKDMSTPIPMDRLICGDVGFGKTEIAMRASFIAVSNKKQVAILVPTTLLVQQHYDNFITRFSDFSIQINKLSRLCTPKETLSSILHVKEGKTDILIGTHQMLSKKIQWFNLGLLIIDEEHRFGVLHKEKIKSLFTNIDILTLTATPIPRTLNMAVHGIRDLSIISTPPDKRLAIKTIVTEYNTNLIRKTILQEISRGGQIYYIYNRIQNINNKAKTLTKLIPEAKIKIGHGEMHAKYLNQIMYDFSHKIFNVLVCTTIIEIGIDIPHANTMIIEDADQFGLSQLHQLRGRIGRLHQQAYAFLLVKNYKNINEDAKKRLYSIHSFQNVGDGLTLSYQDLEIRGIGEILGHDQSGHMGKIGFHFYKEMLAHAINMHKLGEKRTFQELIQYHPEIEINVPALLSSEYVSNVNTRINFYKKIAECNSETELKKIKNELIYQYGTMPYPVKNLITIAFIRIIANNIGIKKIYSNNKEGFLIFHNTHCVNLNWLFKKLQSEPNNWNIVNANKLKFIHNLNENQERLKWILNFITLLYQNRIPMCINTNQ